MRGRQDRVQEARLYKETRLCAGDKDGTGNSCTNLPAKANILSKARMSIFNRIIACL